MASALFGFSSCMALGSWLPETGALSASPAGSFETLAGGPSKAGEARSSGSSASSALAKLWTASQI